MLRMSSRPTRIRTRIQAGRAVKLTHMPKFTCKEIVEVIHGPSVTERENTLQKIFAGPFILDIKLLEQITLVLVEQHFGFDPSIIRFELTNASSYYGSTNVVLDELENARMITKISRVNCKDFVCVAATLAHELIHVEMNLRCRKPSEWDPSHGHNFIQRKLEFEALYPFLGDLVKC